MKSVSFLEKLLGGREFQWKALGELGTFIRGSGIQKSDFTESGAGCIHYGQIHTHYGIWATETKSFIDPEFAARLRKAHAGDLVIATTSEDDEGVAKAVAWLGNEEVAVSTDAYIYRHTINPKYMSYFFQTEIFQKQKKPYITGTKVHRISGDSLAKIRIPIPDPENSEKSLEIQAAIVRILDAFTTHTDELARELAAELTARKKQNSYYRDHLLSFEDEQVEWKKLGEIADFTYGYVASAQDSGDARFVRITDINANGKLIETDPKYVDVSEENKRYLLKKNDLLMARTGATYGKTMIFEEDYPAIYAGFLIKLNINKAVLIPKFYWHFAQSNFFWDQANKLVSGGGQPQLNANALKEVRVPIPYPREFEKSLAEQERIVAILDKFDALTNSISELLPREIELRRKQYEYCRDLLLSFPAPEEAEA